MSFGSLTLVVGAPEKLAGEAINELLEEKYRSGRRVLLVGVTREEVLPGSPCPCWSGWAPS